MTTDIFMFGSFFVLTIAIFPLIAYWYDRRDGATFASSITSALALMGLLIGSFVLGVIAIGLE
jgi:NADH:ubiquinone oxidoreductase subunit 5 (subunit L)/multisubunit Na+/H+ antiporter MnhA subunit